MSGLVLPIAATLLAFAGTAQAAGLGACAWDGTPEADRQAYLAAFNQGAGDPWLQAHDAQLRRQVADCAGRSDIPALWARALMGSQAIKAGAASALAASGVTREQLDALWTQAPAAARDCTRANSAKVFGIAGPACPDVSAPIWFVQALHIQLKPLDRPRAAQALYYYNATAQTEWAEGLIAKMPAP